MYVFSLTFFFFFFNDTATTEIYTLSLHDALPIFLVLDGHLVPGERPAAIDDFQPDPWRGLLVDRKSTRLNSSHDQISYAVFCLKKKKKQKRITPIHKLLQTGRTSTSSTNATCPHT